MSALAQEALPDREAPIAMRFLPAPEHVRTARLVVVAVARRAGFEEERLDDVRLAVGEVCARAAQAASGNQQVTVVPRPRSLSA